MRMYNNVFILTNVVGTSDIICEYRYFLPMIYILHTDIITKYIWKEHVSHVTFWGIKKPVEELKIYMVCFAMDLAL